LNDFDIFLVNISTSRDFFYGIPILRKGHYTDVILARFFSLTLIIVSIIITSIKHFKNNQEKKKKKTYISWVYIYLAINLASICFAQVFYFSFFDPKFDVFLSTFSTALITLKIISLTLNPNVLFLVTSITETTILKLDKKSDVFKKINDLMLNEKLFLIKNLETNVICNKTSFDKKTVLSAILNNAKGNWKTYINDLRVEYAIQLLKKDYLKNHSIISLGEKSGFNSHQSFFRAFKLKTNMTPGEFYKKSIFV
jgi:AraC-like DNA-binding protein